MGRALKLYLPIVWSLAVREQRQERGAAVQSEGAGMKGSSGRQRERERMRFVREQFFKMEERESYHRKVSVFPFVPIR